MASVSKSRFALLKVEDDEEDDKETKQNNANTKSNQQTSNAKKKAKRKKKIDTVAENAELQSLAFGKSGPKHKENGGKSMSKQLPKKEQWDEWQKMDEQYTAEAYEKDLEQALLLSKLDFEEHKDHPQCKSGSGDGSKSGSENKKKKKDKHSTMSLEEFNQIDLNKNKVHTDELDDVLLPEPVSTKLPQTEMDPKFFDKVEDDVSRILRKEKMQEDIKKQYATESVIVAQYQDELKKKDKEIQFLRTSMKKIEAELQEVKKRNKQLCVILGQGEMKDKAKVLMQVDQLSQVRDELTEQVGEMTAELEKERSKNHGLKMELEKVKGSKHSGR
ncbi:hypothetical protein ScPMuIL_018503 [Solemya velum]